MKSSFHDFLNNQLQENNDLQEDIMINKNKIEQKQHFSFDEEDEQEEDDLLNDEKDKLNYQDLFEEIYQKMIEAEGIPQFPIEAAQQKQIADLQAKILMLENEQQTLKRTHMNNRYKQLRYKQILEDQKIESQNIEQVRLSYMNKIHKLTEEISLQENSINTLKKQINTNIEDLHDQAIQRAKQQIKINDQVEIMHTKLPKVQKISTLKIINKMKPSITKSLILKPQ